MDMVRTMKPEDRPEIVEGNKVEIIRAGNVLLKGQVVEVVEVIDKYTIRVADGFARIPVPIYDVIKLKFD